MEIISIQNGHPLWEKVMEFASTCSWRAGAALAERMRENAFTERERVIVAVEDDRIAGFCTFSEKDELPDRYDFTPFIGFVYVDERFRGRRLSGKMIDHAMRLAAGSGFSKVYIMSGEIGLYEKYGFTKLGDYETVYGTTDQLFVKAVKSPSWEKPEEIRGNRIILREQREEDAPFFSYWFNQPKIMFQCGFEKPFDEDEILQMITVSHRSDDSLWFTITDLEGNIVGETGLLRMFPAWHQTDLTIIIPDPAMQNKGYGTEATRMMLDMAFNKYEMHRVSIGVVGLNTEALRFYKKIGFKQEGVLEEAYYYNNEYSDFIMMRILSHEWKEMKENV